MENSDFKSTLPSFQEVRVILEEVQSDFFEAVRVVQKSFRRSVFEIISELRREVVKAETGAIFENMAGFLGSMRRRKVHWQQFQRRSW